jgi:hypothetical protein
MLRAGVRQFENLSTDDFLWRPRDEQCSSMFTGLSPNLEELGPVPPLHVDFVRLAGLVFLADRSALREVGPGVRWDRALELSLPVSDPDAWLQVAGALEQHLHLLTGDIWSLTFTPQVAVRKGAIPTVEQAPAVCLFSGGADSLAGALAAQRQFGAPPVLVSHWDFSAAAGIQTKLAASLQSLWGEDIQHCQLQFQRRKRQVGSGEEFRNEQSRRSRSFLFVALGLAVAAVRDAPLLMSENGFTSINPPLAPERRGSLSTRTTHPAFLDGLTATLKPLGMHVDLSNPFEGKTKGEVTAEAVDGLQPAKAAALFSASHSCGKPPWFHGYPQGEQCGLCYGCLVRRGAFTAAGLSDKTMYIENDLRGDARREVFASPTRMKTVEAARYRLERRYDEADIIGMALPPRMLVADSLALANAGLDELQPVVDDIP